MTLQEFSESACVRLSQILERPGAVLYSAAHTLKEGKYYFLGLNPGGKDGCSIRQHLLDLPSKEKNSYVDEKWDWGSVELPNGRHPLQQNASELFGVILDVPVENVCASNIIFAQSRTETDSGYPQLADLCWPVHELILDIVKPKVIITFGVKAFEFVSSKLSAPRLPDFQSGHANWVLREAVSKQIRIVGLPHLSRYHLKGRENVMRWLRERAG